MSESNSDNDVKKTADQIGAKLSNISMHLEKLEEGARVDMAPKLERLQTMYQALQRDVEEAETPGGADQETASELASNLERETDDLLREVEALSTGNPTTVSAAIDAIDRAVSSD